LLSHHQIEKTIAVVHIEISSAVAISFAHSHYDTVEVPMAPMWHCIIRWNGV
jgi:hypothetical protein